jgi:hypothetical protein
MGLVLRANFMLLLLGKWKASDESVYHVIRLRMEGIHD